MAEKLPYYKRFPKDYLSDENVALMTLEEEGAYNRLMDYCWLQGSIPDDVESLARLCRVSAEKMEELWPSIRPCFDEGEAGRLVHPRMEKERVAAMQKMRSTDSKKTGGRKGAKRRWERRRRRKWGPEFGAMLDEVDGQCPRCLEDRYPLECDHIIPKSQGGKDAPSNYQPLCAKCNSAKGPERTNWLERWRELQESGLADEDVRTEHGKPFDYQRLLAPSRSPNGSPNGSAKGSVAHSQKAEPDTEGRYRPSSVPSGTSSGGIAELLGYLPEREAVENSVRAVASSTTDPDRWARGLLGLYGPNGTADQLMHRVAEEDRPRVLAIALQRLATEGQEYRGNFFRGIVKTVIRETQEGEAPDFGDETARDESRRSAYRRRETERRLEEQAEEEERAEEEMDELWEWWDAQDDDTKDRIEAEAQRRCSGMPEQMERPVLIGVIQEHRKGEENDDP